MSYAVYKFAGVPVMVRTLYRQVHYMAKDYLVDESPVIEIATSQDDIDYEKRLSAMMPENECASDLKDNVHECLAVYRKLSTALLDYDTLLMHGSSISVNDNGVLFTALSGTGKSTHTRLWRELLGEKVVMINDDKPLIHIPKDDLPAMIYGTPWDGKHHLSNNISRPLKAIVHLKRGQKNEIREIDAKEIFPVLIQQIYSPSDSVSTAKVLNLISRLAEKVKFYELHCNMDIEAAQVAYNTIFAQ